MPVIFSEYPLQPIKRLDVTVGGRLNKTGYKQSVIIEIITVKVSVRKFKQLSISNMAGQSFLQKLFLGLKPATGSAAFLILAMYSASETQTANTLVEPPSLNRTRYRFIIITPIQLSAYWLYKTLPRTPPGLWL